MTEQNKNTTAAESKISKIIYNENGKAGYILLWALGVPIPLLFVIYLLRGCN